MDTQILNDFYTYLKKPNAVKAAANIALLHE